MNWWRLSLLYILYLQMPNELIKTFLIIQFYTDCHIPIWVRGGVFNNLPTTNQPYDPKMALPHNLTYVINLEANRVKSPPWAASRYIYIYLLFFWYSCKFIPWVTPIPNNCTNWFQKMQMKNIYWILWKHTLCLKSSIILHLCKLLNDT